jgi:polysaccharide biosynthesis transport protein
MAFDREPVVTRPVVIDGSVGVPAHARAMSNGAHGLHHPQSVNVWRIIHRALRGRYTLAVVMGIACGAAAGAAAWRLGHPIYESQGLIQIVNARPAVMPGSGADMSMSTAEFDAFMQSQKLLISSRRVIDAAIQDPVWKAMGKTVPQPPDKFFADNLKVDVRSRTELIQVTVGDRDAGTAAAAVTSVINAFSDYYISEEKRNERQLIGVLNDNRSALQSEIDRLSNAVDAGTRKFGGSRPDLRCDAAALEVSQLETRLRAVDAVMAAFADARPSSDKSAHAGPTAVSAQTPQDLTPDQLALTDAGMRQLLDEQMRAEQDLHDLVSHHGYLPSHPKVIAAKETLESVRERVARQAAAINKFRRTATPAQAFGGSPADPQSLVGRSPADMNETRQAIVKQLGEARQQMNDLAVARSALEKDQENLRLKKDELEKFEARIEALRNNTALGGKLTVITSGDVPISPARDIRPRLAAGAGLGGLCLPAALIVLYSLLRRKYRYADDTEADPSSPGGGVPLLGILPELRTGDSDVDRLAAASHCVHQIRVSLNAAATARTGPRAYLVTSAASGEGKTTVTMSLGLSFAASRLRTLIIDADLVGRKLTTAFQARDVEGLHESIAAGTIRQRVRRTDSGLYILTAGKAVATDACAIPKSAIRSVIAEARNYFDVILVDSGPIMGSLEASVVAPEVDGVIFAITRGQNRQAADAAMRRLRGLGATVVGCVFNRAKAADLGHSSYGSSSRLSLPDPHQPARALNPFVGEGFGPVVRAVAAAMPDSQN